MRIPLSWLRDYTPVDLAPQELADTFNNLGLIVDGAETIGPEFTGVVVGQAHNVRAHPNADRVRLADVDLGDGGERVQIACGASNLASGQMVPVAKIGAVLPGDFRIERRKLRGEWSNGMICAADELGLSGAYDDEGILVLPDDAPLGQDLVEYLGLESDVVFDLDVETNRPDGLSVVGIARDVAAKLGLPFSPPEPVVVEDGPPIADLASLSVEDPQLCTRFTLRALTGVVVTESPAWIKHRLHAAGMRPINNVVDASNYVMLELGQPSHPYDRRRIAQATLGARAARAGEVLQTLDGTERAIPEGACVIVDGDDVPVGVAGVMGGASSEIEPNTTEVLVEMATFDAFSVNRTSRELALRTEASARFERLIDRDGHLRAQDRLVEVLRETCPKLQCAVGVLDVRTHAVEFEPILLRSDRLAKVLGVVVPAVQVTAILHALGFRTEKADQGWMVRVPSFRPDCTREIDLIEEVGRLYGHRNIPRTLAMAPQAARLTPYQQARRQVRRSLVGLGLCEAWTTSLLRPEDTPNARIEASPVRITNARSSEEAFLRTSLLPGMLRAVSYNLSRQNSVLDFFEIGRVFYRKGAAPDRGPRPYLFAEVGGRNADTATRPSDEFERLFLLRTAPELALVSLMETWRDLLAAMRVREVQIQQAKLPHLHPGRGAELIVREGVERDEVRREGVVLGWMGQVHPEVTSAFGIEQPVSALEVDLRSLLAHIDPDQTLRPISKFPSGRFDLAFILPNETPAERLTAALRASLGSALDELVLYDRYALPEEDHARSLTYTAKVSSHEGTLSEGALTELRARAIADAASVGATLRS